MAVQDAGRVAAGRPGPRVYSCRNCRTHISRSDKIIAETQELHGPVTLFYRAVNIYMGPEQDWRLLAGGLCRVADVDCCGCDECLGWQYTRSHDVPNMFKVGKFCIDSPKIVVE